MSEEEKFARKKKHSVVLEETIPRVPEIRAYKNQISVFFS